MTRRCFGHIPDTDADVEEDLRDRHVGGLIGASVSELPASVDYSAFLPSVPDQGGSSACVGFAFATAIYLRAKLAGHPIDRPSAKGIYDVARLTDARNVLIDDGCRPRAAIDGLQTFGMVSETRWPLTPTNVNDLPPLDVFQHGLGAMIANYYRIGGGDVATLVRSALAKGFLPFFAMPVDNAFVKMNGAGPYNNLTGPALGSHAMCLVGYDADTFLIANSWSASWGAAGFARITSAGLNTLARDVIVPTTSPLKVT